MITVDFEADDTEGSPPFTTIFHGYVFGGGPETAPDIVEFGLGDVMYYGTETALEF
jgi:hypothetical protein